MRRPDESLLNERRHAAWSLDMAALWRRAIARRRDAPHARSGFIASIYAHRAAFARGLEVLP